MSKYGVLYVLIIMIIETIMYSVIVGFDNFIRDDEKPRYPSLGDSDLILNRDACYKKCDQIYDKFSSSTSKSRWKRCRQVCRELEEKLIENIWGTKEHNKKSFIRDNEKVWVLSVDDAYNLETCQRKCNEAYDTSSKKSRNRLYECKKLCKSLNQYIEWCRERCHRDEDTYKKCIEQRTKDINHFFLVFD
ncbi:uncharacterized protein LOC130961286 [Arachis stenosperma]|uniref:uncharacterized protein LOC130961286 n=1 Tax=Arachis stenosperma TaxID=217475 RepID=UPI0025AD83D4|nr:uncharacterized protein LOC130961286 [Arachis stenosperma]